MNAQTRKVLLTSGDRSLLRHLSRLLELFGYQVVAAADQQQVLAAMETLGAGLVIIDGELGGLNGLDICRSIRDKAGASRDSYLLLLTQEPKAAQLIQALEAGVDDFLCKPIAYGELLARLQAGAQVLDSQWRLDGHGSVDRLTGLIGRRAFIERLNTEFSSAVRESQPLSCVMIDMDFFDRINDALGRNSANSVLQLVAQRLDQLCDEGAWTGRIAGDRFCIVLPGVSDVRAAVWAERARSTVAEEEWTLTDQRITVTASLGVAGRTPEVQTAIELLERASDALQAAKRSGRNCVVRAGQLAEEVSQFHALAAPDKLFEGTLARDVMTPCALRFQEDELLDDVSDLISKSRYGHAPIMDAQGKFVGLLSRDACDTAGPRARKSSRHVADIANRNIPSYDEETTFKTLFEFFVSDGRSEVVITHRGEPTGIVMRDDLAGLIEPRPSRQGDAEGSVALPTTA